MHFATRPRLFWSHMLPLLVVFAGLVSSCQSSRPSFVFQPAPGRPRVVATALPAVPDSAVVRMVAVAPEASLHVAPAPKAIARTTRRWQQLSRSQPAARPAENPVVASRTPKRALLHRSHGAAEAGLGTTVLGVLGLVVLPFAVLGLVLSGGALGWIIVGGLAALAVLVAYIDPDGR